MQLSNNFFLHEFTRSETADEYGIENTPNTEELLNIQSLVCVVLQPVRDRIKMAMDVSSGFRCEVLNNLVGGAEESQHRKGEAADITARLMTCKVLAETIIRMKIPFDQMIWEKRHDGVEWIHISFKRVGENRQEVLTAYIPEKGETVYKTGLSD